VLIILSLGLVVALMVLGAAPPRTLILGWIIAGLLTLGIRHIVARFRLDGGASVKAFAISWPLLTVVQCSVICLFPSSSITPHPSPITPNLSPLTLLAILAIISLQMSLWQRRVAIIKHLLLGLIIGLISTLHPHLILIVLLLPIAGYYMRCLSPRNLLSAITGTALGIWIIYLIVCILPLLGSKEGGIAAADRMIMAYLPPNLSPLISNQVLPLGRGTEGVSLTPLTLYLVLLLFIHTLTSFAVDLGQSVRTEASIIMLSIVSIAFIALLFLDAAHLPVHLVTLAMLLALLLTIHQANAHHPLVEWWILLIQLVGYVLALLPAVA
jgi:hypothetical protein